MDPTLINDKDQKRITDLEDLPKEIIGDILSILPIKDAVRTSVLSKKWQHRWKGMSGITLIENEYDSRELFNDVADKLLTSCFSNLKKFYLACGAVEDDDISEVNEWLDGFIKPSIEELNLHLGETSQELVLPEHLFNSKSLTHLELDMEHPIILPSFIHFPSLRVLILKDVIFTGTDHTQNLFFDCPFLQELRLFSCIWNNVESLRIDSPLLHSLYIEDWQVFPDDHHPPSFCKIVINGNNNLKTFFYDGLAVNLYELSFAPNVTSAALDFQKQHVDNILDPGQLVFTFLVAISNVKTLSINRCALKDLCHSSYLARMTFMFCKLDKLQVMFDEERRPMNLACCAMQIILRHAPILKSLKFIQGVVLPKDIDEAPACFETHIKYIAIRKFSGTDKEKAAVKLLLKWAKVVSQFDLFIKVPEKTDEDKDNRQKLMDEIAEYPKSETCNLCFG